jgi:large subunit ribosomal protein L15
MERHALRAAAGAKKRRKRVARGHGGRGHKTAGRGTKGQKSRSSSDIPAWFEGGQTPFVRRLPHRRGFSNARFRVVYQPVNVGALASAFEAGATITPADMVAQGLARSEQVKVLGDGEVSHQLSVQAPKFSQAARAKIEAAGGSVTEG